MRPQGAINGSRQRAAVEAAALGIAEPTAQSNVARIMKSRHLYMNGVRPGSPYWRGFPRRSSAWAAARRARRRHQSIAFDSSISSSAQRAATPRAHRCEWRSRVGWLVPATADLARPAVRRHEIEASARGIAFLAAGCPATCANRQSIVFQPFRTGRCARASTVGAQKVALA